MMALDVFREYLSRPRKIAVVVDEYGGVEGVISHADIIEEMLEDAAPTPETDVEISEIEPGRFLVSGDARLDEIREHTGVDLEQEGLDTIGGLFFKEFGQVPEIDDAVELDGARMTVRNCEGSRITRIVLELGFGAKGGRGEDPDQPEKKGRKMTGRGDP